MSNVVSLRGWADHQTTRTSNDVLIDCFSRFRRSENDVFWLKENAELLNILESQIGRSGELDLSAYLPFYNNIDRRLCFFRQYYRFYLSICMDLEDLGFGGEKSQVLAAWVHTQKLADLELSDLQRAEAERLLARRNIGRADPGLSDRLRRFACDSARFAMPNSKVAYELTHIVFYLSEYGRRDPDLPSEAVESLRNVGILAYLDQNMDLLAEVCISLRFAKAAVPVQWEQALAQSQQRYRFIPDGFDGTHDDYHAYFVGAWWAMTAGQGGFDHAVPSGATQIRGGKAPGVMKSLSQLMYNDESLGALAWTTARNQILAALPLRDGELLQEAENSIPDFERFYDGFARGGRAR